MRLTRALTISQVKVTLVVRPDLISNESSFPERVINFPTSSTKDNNWAYFNIDEDPELVVNVQTVRNDGQANNFTMTVTLKPKYWHNLVLATTTTDGYASIEIMVDETMIEQEENWGVEPY